MSAASLFGLIENSNPNPITPVDFQQSPGFIAQFGSGQAGFSNWLSQALARSPNLSIGDAYAQYNAGTGTPGIGTTFTQLATLNPAAYSNALGKITAAGYSPDTPISAIEDALPTNGDSNPFSFTCENCDQTTPLGGDPNANFDIFGNDTGTLGGSSVANASGAPVTGSGGGGSASQASTGFFPGLLDAATTLFQRGTLIIFGLVLIAGGAYVMAKNDVSPGVIRA